MKVYEKKVIKEKHPTFLRLHDEGDGEVCLQLVDDEGDLICSLLGFGNGGVVRYRDANEALEDYEVDLPFENTMLKITDE